MANKSPEDMMKAVTDSMQERTGKCLDEWVREVLASGLNVMDQNSVRKWLKDQHGIAQNTQWAIADAAAQAAGWVRPSVEEYINSQYYGDKVGLRPIFDKLRALAEGLGENIIVEGRGGYTPFVHKRQFAAVEAATKTRVDLGLRFKQAPVSPLLRESKGPGQSTHKISLQSTADVTDEVARLLKIACEQN